MTKQAIDLSWAPPFSLRRSARAKRLSLRFDPKRGLEIVLPLKISEKKGLSFLSDQRAWVEKQLALLAKKENKQNHLSSLKQIYLPSINQHMHIVYRPILGVEATTLKAFSDRLVIYGDTENHKMIARLLRDWIKKKAIICLPDLLADIANDCGLSYRKVGVRDQKTRWGSCNSYQDIQLNYRLLLLPADVTRYVMVHELCHTVHMNHAPVFWALVASFDQHYKKHINMLKNSHEYLPQWLEG